MRTSRLPFMGKIAIHISHRISNFNQNSITSSIHILQGRKQEALRGEATLLKDLNEYLLNVYYLSRGSETSVIPALPEKMMEQRKKRKLLSRQVQQCVKEYKILVNNK